MSKNITLKRTINSGLYVSDTRVIPSHTLSPLIHSRSPAADAASGLQVYLLRMSALRSRKLLFSHYASSKKITETDEKMYK